MRFACFLERDLNSLSYKGLFLYPAIKVICFLWLFFKRSLIIDRNGAMPVPVEMKMSFFSLSFILKVPKGPRISSLSPCFRLFI